MLLIKNKKLLFKEHIKLIKVLNKIKTFFIIINVRYGDDIMFNLKGRVAVVTGASSGLGRQMAKAFAK